MAKEDEKLPLARHIVGTLQYLHFVEDFVVIVFMRAKEVIVSKLSFGAIVFVQKVLRGITTRAGAGVRDITI